MINRVSLLKYTLSHSFDLLIFTLPNLRSATKSENWKTICSTFFEKHIRIQKALLDNALNAHSPNKMVKWDVNIL